MWNYSLIPNNSDIIQKVSKNAFIAGIVMIIIGAIAIIYPFIGSLFTVAFIAWLMILAGFMVGFSTYKSNPHDWLGWLKGFILIISGMLMVMKPNIGIEAVGLILAIYFLLDTFAGFAMGSLMSPVKGWWLWTLNGFLSLILAIIFLTSWADVEKTAWLIGIFVGISLLFDGFSLLFVGNSLKKVLENR